MRLFIIGLFILLGTTFDFMYVRVQRAQKRCEHVVGELQDALARIRTLSGLLPICSVCRKIRDDQGNWHKLESYMREHSEAEFSHGYCPDCYRKTLTELEQQRHSPATDGNPGHGTDND